MKFGWILDNDGNTGNNAFDYESDTYSNPNQEKYVYDILYKATKTAALDEAQKNKFQIKGRYKSSGGTGIPIGAFNVPRGSVKVTAGGRVLVEGVDYTVNYQGGTVQILDPALQASNTPIQVSVENNAVFGQQTKQAHKQMRGSWFKKSNLRLALGFQETGRYLSEPLKLSIGKDNSIR